MKSKLKIAILNYTIGRVERGGELGMQMLADDLSRLGHAVDVYQGKPLPKKPQYNQIIINTLATPTSHKPRTTIPKILERLYIDKNGLLTLWFSLKALPQLLAGSYDIYFPVNGFWQIIVCKLAVILNAGKIVVSGKAGIGWTDHDNLRLHPDLFVPISRPAETWAKQLFPQTTITYIPEAIDTDTFHPKTKPAPTTLQHPIIMTVSAFSAYKRVDCVIRAVSRIPNASLLLVGHGEEESTLRQLAQSLLPGRHQFTTATYTQLPHLYTSADVFTLASESQEAFGRVLIEALASGLPVVTTDDPLRRSILGSVGIYTNPTNEQTYANSLTQAIKNPHKPSYFRHAALPYRRNIIAKQYDHAFKNIL